MEYGNRFVILNKTLNRVRTISLVQEHRMGYFPLQKTWQKYNNSQHCLTLMLL